MKTSDHAANAGAGPRREWRILSEFTIPGEPGGEALALARIAEAVKVLHKPGTTQHQVPPALGRALGESLARNRRHNVSASLSIRVLVPAEPGGDGAEEGEPRGPARSVAAAATALAAAAGSSQAHGCGFFLVDRATGSHNGGAQQATDIFLYVEGGLRQDPAAHRQDSA